MAEARPNAGSAELASVGPGRLALRGVLDFGTARAVHESGLGVLAASTDAQYVVDCEGITHANSAGVAVLVEWLGWARANGRRLRYENLPASVRAVASISELDELLNAGV